MALWTIFIAVAVFFLLVLIVGVVFDGILDMFDVGGDGVLSMTSVGGAGTGFGVGGAIAVSSFDAGVDGGVIAGVLGAALFGFISVKLARFISGMDAESLSQESKIGSVGYALTGAEASQSFEFMISHDGQRKKISAISDDIVKPGDALVVEAVLSPTRLKVRQQNQTDGDKSVKSGSGGTESIEEGSSRKGITETATSEKLSVEELSNVTADDLESLIVDTDEEGNRQG